MPSLNSVEISKWFAANGDNTHNVTDDLNEDSVIMDFGGYAGVWAQQMINKYNPNVYVLEPVPEFYNQMVTKFANNSKVRLMNVGVGIENKEGMIFMSGDATSSNISSNKSIDIKFNTVETILKNWGLSEIDLVQINIEGDEYSLLEHMLETGDINKFKNIQVQFHLGVENDIIRRNNIREGLIKNRFEINFDYPFVWESWKKK
jgi:FkbM family methyltransferase